MSLLETTELEQLVQRLKPEMESMIRDAIRDAMHDVPTITNVQQMIDARIEQLQEATNERIKGVDAHLQFSQDQLKQTTLDLKSVISRFELFITEQTKAAARLEERDLAQQEVLDKQESRIAIIEQQAVVDRREITDLINHYQQLRRDVHGDPNNPLIPSLYSVIKANHETVLGNFQRLADEQQKIGDRLEAVEGFITTQKTALKALVGTFKAVWRTGRGKLLIGAVVAGLTTLPETAPFHAIIKSVLGLP